MKLDLIRAALAGVEPVGNRTRWLIHPDDWERLKARAAAIPDGRGTDALAGLDVVISAMAERGKVRPLPEGFAVEPPIEPLTFGPYPNPFAIRE